MTLVDVLEDDPLLLRYVDNAIRHIESGKEGAPRITGPRDAIGEQRMFALGALKGVMPYFDVTHRLGIAPRRLTQDEVAAIGTRIYSAVPYLFLTKIHRLALDYNLPRHIVGDDLPHPSMYWTFEGSLPITVNGVRDGSLLDALLIERWEDGLRLVQFIAKTRMDAQPAAVVLKVPFGSRYPEDVDDRVKPFLSFLAFVNSPYVDTAPKRTVEPGAKTKWHGRRVYDNSAVHVVALRSAIREAVEAERGQGPQWRGRWVVRGHYRAQWYPSTGTHKVIWIAPYLKGPEDAELVPQMYAVVR